MRTTLNLPDALIDAAKQRAREEGGTLTSFIEDALRRRLELELPRSSRRMPVFGEPQHGGLLVDLADRDRLWEIFDARADPVEEGGA